jgi:hypothetical protein
MNGVIVTYEIPEAQIRAITQAETDKLEKDLNTANEELLKLVTQAHFYTATGNPSRPAGSEYQRTFNLRDAGEIVGDTWRVNESVARYARYVIGSRADQATIHRGRWKSLEEVTQDINEKAPGIVKKHIG